MPYAVRLGFPLIALVLTALALGACQKEPAGPQEKVVATVNGKVLTERDLGFYLRRPHRADVPAGAREKALEQLVQAELMYQQGVALGLDANGQYQDAIALMEARVRAFKREQLMRLVINREITPKSQVSSEEYAAYYEAHKETLETEYHLGVLLSRSVEEAKKVRAEVEQGASFELIAAQKAAERARGGKGRAISWDMGFLPWDKLPRGLHDLVATMEVGKLTGVVEGRRGDVRLYKLIAKRKNPKATPDALRPAVISQLRNEKLRAERTRYLEALAKDAKVVYSEKK